MSSKKGVSALASMVALGAIIVLVTGTTIWVENNRTTNYSSDVNSSNVIAAAEGALQDALLKLNLKNSAENYSLVINGATVGVCYEADPSSTGLYTIKAKAIKGNTTRAMKALVNKDLNTLKFNIYSKEEELDSTCVVTAATVPSAPLNPIWASSASGQVTINWSAPTSNGGASITNYKVYRGVSSGGETLLTTLGNILTITDTGLTNNALYYYKISAVNSVGESALSTEVSAIPGQTPTGTVTVSHYASGNYVGATYDITGTFNSNTTAISCNYSTNGGTTWLTGPAPTGTLPNYTCAKSGVPALDNTVYNITMRMTNSIGPGATPSITKTGDATGPSIAIDWPDTAWTATSPLTVTLTPTDSGVGISTTKYCTGTSDSCDPTSGTVGLSTSFTCSGNNCTNYIRYASWDLVNNASAVYSRRVRQDKLAPTDGTLTVTPGAYQNSLSWSGFSDSGSGLAGANTYKVVFLTTGSPNATCSNGTQAYLGTGTSSIHSSLTGGTTYYYRICAYDGVGNISNGAVNTGIPTTTTTTSCVPNCAGKNCGSNGCAGTCGTCSGSDVCSGGVCVPTCTPNCAGKNCGSNGCSGSCGTCTG
ncbi:MAG: fibronectin type III domain-containing protein, partial [Minisyncoccia bacterium]